MSKNSLLGFAKIQFTSGLIIGEIAIQRSGNRVWASPPARPWIEDNALMRDHRGRPRYQSLIDFANHGVRASWNRQVLRAVRAEHPDLFKDIDDDRTGSIQLFPSGRSNTRT